jgi:hypothetical protein
MASVFGKLQLKDQTLILVMNAPASFESELAGLTGVQIMRDPGDVERIDWALVFVTTKAQVDATIPVVVERAPGDAAMWVAYPMGTAKTYQSDLKRDVGWEALSAAGFRPVRQVAIDEDWSALRFRRTEYVKRTLRR